jgi:Tol biopolymer transport system component
MFTHRSGLHVRNSTRLAATTMKTLLVSVTSVGVLALAAIPAGAKAPGTNGRIAFERGNGFVFTVNPDGSNVQQLVPYQTCCAHWSPDGGKISIGALTDDGRITTATVNPDGSNYEVKTIPDPTLNLGCGAWSPDGDRFACEGWDDVRPDRAAGLFSVRTADFGGLVRLTTNPYGGHDIPGDYSPDGTRIVFLRDNPLQPQGQTAVFVANSDGTSLRQITPWALHGCCSVTWSPDGTTILFDARGSLYAVSPDGSDLRKIPVGVHDGRSHAFVAGWSPDGKRIGFTLCLQKRQQCDVYTMKRDGTDVVQVTNTPQFKEFDDWGPSPVTP